MSDDTRFQPGSGLLFKNFKKRSFRSPDWSGTYTNMAGKQFRVALWESGDRARMKMQPKEDGPSDGE